MFVIKNVHSKMVYGELLIMGILLLKRLFYYPFTLIFSLLILCSGQSTADSADDILDLLSDLEGKFPIPSEVAELEMGVFDASTGDFRGLTTTIIEPIEIETADGRTIFVGGRAEHVGVPEFKTSAINVNLNYSITGSNQSGARLKANNRNAFFSNGGATIRVPSNVGEVEWNTRAGDKIYSDLINIRRDELNAYGDLELPMLPLGFVYDLPTSLGDESTVTYQYTNKMVTKVRFHEKELTSTTSNSYPTNIAKLSKLQGTITKVGKFLKNVGAIGIATKIKIDKLNDAVTLLVGSQETTNNEKIINNSDKFLELSTSTADRFAAPKLGGPGVGDVVRFIKSPKFGWAISDGFFELSILDHDGIGTVNIRNESAMRSFGWDDATIVAIQNLNPFFHSPNIVDLDRDRFKLLRTLSGLPRYEFDLDESQFSGTGNGSTNIAITTTEFTSGLLAKIGFGDSRDGRNVSLMEYSHNRGDTEQIQMLGKVDVTLDPNKVFLIYYDQMFGTLAFTEYTPDQDTPISSGVLDTSDIVLDTNLISITIDGVTHTTHIDSAGRYKIPGITSQVESVDIQGARHGNFSVDTRLIVR